ncbi:hypothetical protein LY76DRAFT_585789 [Colletotrichum caudatum]|nr:hypothetical protein LY76DRAFT_585789 [Colletotrichum caudatum]
MVTIAEKAPSSFCDYMAAVQRDQGRGQICFCLVGYAVGGNMGRQAGEHKHCAHGECASR